MDCNADILFKRVLNCLVLNPAPEFVIEHADKCEKFLERFWKLIEEKNLKQRIIRLSQNFANAKHGASEINLRRFHIIDRELTECMRSASKSFAKKKFGYPAWILFLW